MDETKNTSTTENVVDDNDPVVIIDRLKARHQEDEKNWNAKYNNLLNQYMQLNLNGAASTEDAPKTPSKAELDAKFKTDIKEVAENHISSLEQAERILAIRQHLLDDGKPDIFVADIGTPTADDLESAQNTADVLEYCIDKSEGSNEIFCSALQNRLSANNYYRR